MFNLCPTNSKQLSWPKQMATGLSENPVRQRQSLKTDEAYIHTVLKKSEEQLFGFIHFHTLLKSMEQKPMKVALRPSVAPPGQPPAVVLQQQLGPVPGKQNGGYAKLPKPTAVPEESKSPSQESTPPLSDPPESPGQIEQPLLLPELVPWDRSYHTRALHETPAKNKTSWWFQLQLIPISGVTQGSTHRLLKRMGNGPVMGTLGCQACACALAGAESPKRFTTDQKLQAVGDLALKSYPL